jgi:hypothetical protein
MIILLILNQTFVLSASDSSSLNLASNSSPSSSPSVLPDSLTSTRPVSGSQDHALVGTSNEAKESNSSDLNLSSSDSDSEGGNRGKPQPSKELADKNAGKAYHLKAKLSTY